jgi:hypothetical protein
MAATYGANRAVIVKLTFGRAQLVKKTSSLPIGLADSGRPHRGGNCPTAE